MTAMIDRKALLGRREHIISQRDNALAVYHQAVGALALIDNLLETVDHAEHGMPLEKFAEAIGANSAEIVDLKQAS